MMDLSYYEKLDMGLWRVLGTRADEPVVALVRTTHAGAVRALCAAADVEVGELEVWQKAVAGPEALVDVQALSTEKVPEPQFKHDCEACVFLGRWTKPETKVTLRAEYDLYVCPRDLGARGGSHTCCIARFSSDGSGYTSMTLPNKLWDESLAAISGPRELMLHCYIPALCKAWERWCGYKASTGMDGHWVATHQPLPKEMRFVSGEAKLHMQRLVRGEWHIIMLEKSGEKGTLYMGRRPDVPDITVTKAKALSAEREKEMG